MLPIMRHRKGQVQIALVRHDVVPRPVCLVRAAERKIGHVAGVHACKALQLRPDTARSQAVNRGISKAGLSTRAAHKLKRLRGASQAHGSIHRNNTSEHMVRKKFNTWNKINTSERMVRTGDQQDYLCEEGIHKWPAHKTKLER